MMARFFIVGYLIWKVWGQPLTGLNFYNMNVQYITLGVDGWHVIVYYNAGPQDREELYKALLWLDCPKREAAHTLNIAKHKNTGFTFSNSDYKTSIVCISNTTSKDQFVSTVVHEAKHVQSHICSFYDIDEDGEEAAYLIGYIVRKIYLGIININ